MPAVSPRSAVLIDDTFLKSANKCMFCWLFARQPVPKDRKIRSRQVIRVQSVSV